MQILGEYGFFIGDQCKNMWCKSIRVNNRAHFAEDFFRYEGAFDYAGNLSDRESGEFSVMDTADGSEYGAYIAGEIIR